MAIYGIDLGTTYCAAAYVQDGVVHCVALDGASTSLSSTLVLQESPRGVLRALAGKDARRATEGLWLRGAKNYIGQRKELPGGPPWDAGGARLWSTDAAALLLRTLAARIRAQPNLPSLTGVVVTHPQRFRNAERLATAQAVELAGLRLEGMVTEPDAAAWAWGLSEREHEAQRVLVFDFGGGTLDVSLLTRVESAALEAPGPRFKVMASYGTQLGGLQLDRAIMGKLREQLEAPHGPWSVGEIDQGSPSFHEHLLELAEALKLELHRELALDAAPLARARSMKLRMGPRGEALEEGPRVR